MQEMRRGGERQTHLMDNFYLFFFVENSFCFFKKKHPPFLFVFLHWDARYLVVVERGGFREDLLLERNQKKKAFFPPSL